MGIFSKSKSCDLHATEEINGVSNTHKQERFSYEDTQNQRMPPASSKISTIELMCSHCGGTMIVDDDREILSCPYCGCKSLIPLSDNVRIQKIKSNTYREVELSRQQTQKDIEFQKQKSYVESERTKAQAEKTQQEYALKKKRQEHLADAMGFILPILLMLLMIPFFEYRADLNEKRHQNDVKISTSISECIGGNLDDVTLIFKSAGFKDITTIGLEDLTTGWITKEYSIEKITINGDSTFETGDYFPKDAEVKIYYHSFKNKD